MAIPIAYRRQNRMKQMTISETVHDLPDLSIIDTHLIQYTLHSI